MTPEQREQLRLAELELAQAELEELQRLEASRSLAAYVSRTNPGMVLGQWQLRLCLELELFAVACERGESPRLLVFAPPQHGKSTVVAKAFPAWLLSLHPGWPIILASYASSLAESSGRWVRNTLEDPRNLAVFPDALVSDDNRAVGEFAMAQGGQFLARGVGGGTTGRPARVFIIDDPFADREEAESPVIRGKVKDWYYNVALTRLAPGGGMLIMHTRWHQEDLAGVVLDLPKTLPGADVFRVLKFQALDENDKALHEERYSAAFLKKQRAQMSGRDWNSIYQQEPISEKGDYFKPADLRTYGVCPPRGALALSFDLALKTKQENDCCAISAFGCSADGSVVFGPRIVNERMDILASCKLILEMAIEVDAIELVTEAGNIEGAVGPLLRKMMSELDPPRYWPIWTFPPRSDKKARARSLQGRAQAGKVLFPSGVMFETVIKPQFLGFGAVKHDDLVDMAAQACLYLDRAQNQKTKMPAEKTPLQIERERKRAIIKRGLKRGGADAESEAAQYRLFAGEKAET